MNYYFLSYFGYIQLGPFSETETNILDYSAFLIANFARPKPIIPSQLEPLMDIAVQVHSLLNCF
jgi:hypothetical protein